MDVAGALVINDSSAFSFRGNCTSDTGVSGFVSAFKLCCFPQPATPVSIASVSESVINFLKLLFFISILILSVSP